MTEITGKQRLERLYKRLMRDFPNEDIRFTDESLECDPVRYFGYKVAYFYKGELICDAIWTFSSFGNENGLLEFAPKNSNFAEGFITERRAYNLFKNVIKV